VIRERYATTGKMDNIKDVKLSSLGDSNYVKPLRMHYTQACIVSTHIPKQECCMIFVLMYKMHVRHNIGMLFRLCSTSVHAYGYNCNRPMSVSSFVFTQVEENAQRVCVCLRLLRSE